MPLTLSDRDLKRLEEVQHALLSVLDEAGPPDAWCREVVDRVSALFRTERTMLLLPHRSGFEMEVHPDLERFKPVVRKALSAVEPGAIRYEGEQLDGAFQKRRQASLEVWTNRALEELDERPMEEMPFYHEFMVPAGVTKGGGLAVSLPRGEAVLTTVPGYPDENPFGEEWLELARLMLPAFKSAARALQRREHRQDELLRAVDGMGRALLVTEPADGKAHRNPALVGLLSRCPDPERLLEEVEALVECMSLLRRPPSKAEPSPPPDVGERKVTVDGAGYRLRGLYLRPGLVGRRAAVLVEVEETTPRLPSEAELRKRFSLTSREAEVTLLLARGATNREAGDALGISPHTVRTHAQRIFRKLGVHTRKALALRLLGGSSRPPGG